MAGWLARTIRDRDRREHGQSLILFAAGLAGFCGLVGMAVDVGFLVYTRTDLQKAADAAALAGSQDLPNATLALSSADTYVTKNGGAACQPNCATVNAANDTITVTTTRHVDYMFLKVVGMSGADVHATAVVKSIQATGFAFSNPATFPYAIWGGNPSYGGCGAPYGLCAGAQKTYRSNSWTNQVAQSEKNNDHWTVNGNNFKGYFNTSDHQQTVYQSDPTTQYSFGGNAMGQEPVDALHDAWVHHTPIIVPVLTRGSCSDNCGTLNFTIVAWVALSLDEDPAATNGAWTGTITNYAAPGGVSGGYVAGGGAAQVRSASMIQ